MQTTVGEPLAGFASGRWFSDLVGPALDRFVDPTVGPALALLILTVGTVTAITLAARVVWIERRLARPARVLRAIHGVAAFGQRFDEVDAALVREPLTAHGWSEFKESLVHPARAGDPIWNTARPGRYLNRHEAGLHYRVVQSLPNVFVGVGLLFTFIGLVAALKVANTGIAGQDMAATTRSLAELLGAATAKFYTSIAGLFCSILLGFAIRYGLVRIDRAFAVLANLLEARLVAATPESLTSRLLAQAEEQTKQLKLINTDIAVAIGGEVRKALDAALPLHLAHAATPLRESVTAMIEAVSSQNRDGVGEMIKAFGDRLEGATNDRMAELAETLARLVAALDATSQRMGQGGDNLGAALRGAAGQLAATVEVVRETVAGLAQRMRAEGEAGQARLDEQLGRMEETMSAMASRLVAAVEEGAARAREGAGQASEALVSQVAEAAERLGAVAGGIEAAIARAGESAGAAVRETAEGTARELAAAGAGAAAELRGAVADMGARLGAFGEELARATAAMRELEARVAGHARAIGEAEGGTRAAAGALGETAVRIRTAAGEAGEGLRGAAQPLLAVGERLAQAAEAARRSNESLERVVGETAEQARRQAETAESALERLERVWEQHAQRFEVVDRQLGDAFNEIGARLRENLGHLARFSGEIDRHAATAVDRLAAAIEELAAVAGHPHPSPGAPNGQRLGKSS